MRIKRFVLSLVAFAIVSAALTGGLGVVLRAEANDGPVIHPGTNHFYEAVAAPGGITWVNADAAASAMTFLGCSGHLATVTSEAENDFIMANFPAAGGSDVGPFSSETMGYWIGGHDTGSNDFVWVTGEAFSYENFTAGEPNNDSASDGIHFDPRPFGDETIGGWNDANDSSWLFPGYVVEYSCFDSIEACKKGGWENFKDPDGNPIFKNQGDCVAFIQTSGGNEPGQNVPTSQE